MTHFLNSKVIASQSSAAKEGYQRAGEIAYAAVSGIRTILSLNAVGFTIDKYKDATKEARDTATKREWALGFANGAVSKSFRASFETRSFTIHHSSSLYIGTLLIQHLFI